jgi:hypothetical protein
VNISFGLVALAGSILSTAALILFGYMTGAVRPSTAIFATPVPYALLILSWFGGTSFLLLLRPWLGLRLRRFLVVACAAGILLFVYRGSQWNWHPVFLNWGTFAFYCGLPIIWFGSYWLTLRTLWPEWAD